MKFDTTFWNAYFRLLEKLIHSFVSQDAFLIILLQIVDAVLS